MSNEKIEKIEKKTMLADTNGKPSSKRVAGLGLLISGAVLLLSVGISAIFKMIADPSTALAAGNMLVLTGGALIGAGVIETIGGKK